MKVLVLLLGAIAITEASHWVKDKREAEELRDSAEHAENNIKTFDGEFGIMRKNRLQKIAALYEKHRPNQTEEDREAMKLFNENFVPAKIASSTPVNDPFTVNQAAGVAEYLFEGDIELTDEQLDEIERQLEDVDVNGRSKRQMTSDLARRWTNNRVNYYFDSSTSSNLKSRVKSSLNYLQSITCLTFQENSSAENRVKVWNGGRCSSGVGMSGKEQDLSLDEDGCLSTRTIIHEFSHALGVSHMQSRSDRDQYVTVQTSNIQAAYQHNYNKLAVGEDINYTPYEYGSSMSYNAYQFTNGKGLPMIAKDPAYLYTMGGPFTTFYDIDRINEHYGCYAKCPKSSMCKNGGKPNPANCNVCNCPLGYGGNYCDQRPSGCGAELTATSTWQNQTINIGDGSTTAKDTADFCNYWIRAPAGYKIEVKLSDSWNLYCAYGCRINGIEFKTDSQVATNPRICCDEFRNKPQISKLNPTPVIVYNSMWYSRFTVAYRMVPGTAAQPTSQEEAN